MSGYGGYGGYSSQPAAPYGGYPAAGGSRDLNTIQLARPDFSSLAPFEKNFYIEHPAVAARSEADVQAYRQSREIHVDGVGIPKPVVTFDEASFPGPSNSTPHSLMMTGGMSCQQRCLTAFAVSCRVCLGRGDEGWLH